MASHERDDKEYVHYDDLFQENNIIISPTTHESADLEGFSSSSGASYFSSPPPSDFSSPFGSEIGSTTESEDDDFISELNQLTRRMAEYTFQDDEEDEFQKIFNTETVSKNFEANELKNQPQLKKQGVLGHGGKRVNKGTENVKEAQNVQNRGEGKAWRKRMLMCPSPAPTPPVSAGSGMRAVFLGGSNTRNGSSGTGVFLPSGTYSSAEPKTKRKSGCSTVLIPARVLQTLQQHFNNVGAKSQSNSNGDGSTTSPWQNDVLARINGLLSQQKEHAQFQTRPALTETNHDQEEEEVMKLPPEWTY